MLKTSKMVEKANVERKWEFMEKLQWVVSPE